MVRGGLKSALEVVGFAAIVAGCSLIAVPLGLIVAGIGLIAAANAPSS